MEHPRLGTLRSSVEICGVPVKTFEAVLQHGEATRGGCHVESDQIRVHLRRPIALLVVSMRAVRWWRLRGRFTGIGPSVAPVQQMLFPICHGVCDLRGHGV